MAMLCLFHRSSMCRPGHCALMRSELLDLTTIISATACHQSNYVEPYSRYKSESVLPFDHTRFWLSTSRPLAGCDSFLSVPLLLMPSRSRRRTHSLR